MKRCSKCKVEQEKSEFYKRKTNKDGLRYWCKTCDKKQATKWNKNNPEKHAFILYHWKKENPEKNKKQQKKATSKYLADPANKIKLEARRQVKGALRNGRLTKEPCFCGEVKMESHHKDYSKPLDVEWLCKKHHVEKERSLENES